MAGEWAHVPLSELTETPATYGVVQPGQNLPTGLPMLRVNNFRGHSLDLSEVMRIAPEIEAKYERTRIQAGDVLITIVGSVGQVAIVSNELSGWNIARAVAMIRPKESELSRWIAFVLRSPFAQYQLGVAANTTVQTTINLKDLRELRIPFPAKDERRAIAHILGTLDDKIENNRKTAKTLEAMAQAIFQSWFVDFDPVRAKMAGEPPESICKRLKITPEILDLFPDRLVDSELGEIPEGWRVGVFGDFADIVGGSTPSTNKPEYWLSGIHSWATPKDLSRLTMPVLLSTENKITDAGLQHISSRLLPAGTVLLSSRAPIGYIAIAEIPVAINQGFIALKPHNYEYCIFLLFLIKHNMEEIISRANGSTFLEISKAKFRPISVVSPAEGILQSFAKLAMPLFLRIVSIEKMTRILAVQRDTLLPKLISGEIRVPEAEHLIEEATG
ncbi:hypothetical protein BBC27_00185 [Acidithiobacillus ferrivorans]|uniref:Type I restriction modification DNA specificity domain-containing protein n=1 Tax=Acidithiobacillus ferrivorans TaxID=160808 RepID=A0A1B9C211_9PROT|nr:restriction endonuclease subunit S [Acidithiobacillus ferrivorans]OCB04007.1 hypothetical protein BBC27_00185 [Acidithiobacillus ferrivorans]